jgi:hypothetical protein
MYYSREDGGVGAVDLDLGKEVATIPAASFMAGNPGEDRVIAVNQDRTRLWYTGTDGQIYSLNLSDATPGPKIAPIPDAPVTPERHLFIDYAHDDLLIPFTDGSVHLYAATDLQPVKTIPASFFTDGNVGGLRHFASDIRTRTLWYAAMDGSFVEMDPETVIKTGRVIPFRGQKGGNPGPYRHFAIVPTRNLLLYSVTDGSVASIDLGTFQQGAMTLSSGDFDSAAPGARRIITHDALAVALRIATHAADHSLLLSWNPYQASATYIVEFNAALGATGWVPVAPTNQWPNSATSLSLNPQAGASGFWRVLVQP